MRPVCHHLRIIRDDVTCETLIISSLGEIVKCHEELQQTEQREGWTLIDISSLIHPPPTPTVATIHLGGTLNPIKTGLKKEIKPRGEQANRKTDKK